MTSYLLRRVGFLPAALVVVLCIVFVIVHLSGNAVDLLLPEYATAAQRAQLAQQMHLNDPLILQFLRFALGAVHGDLGESYFYQQPALAVVAQHIPYTAELALSGMGIAVLSGLVFGVVAALREGTMVDTAIVSASVLGQSMPSFWLGLMLILLFAVQLRLLPTSGSGDPSHLVLPAITVAAYQAPQILLLTRTSMLNVLNEPYMTVARAKGLRSHVVVLSHGLRNAIGPVLTSIGLQFGTLAGGSVITETIFAWPGVGRLSVQAIFEHDLPLVEACIFVLAIGVLLSNFVVDLAAAVIDPRTRERT